MNQRTLSQLWAVLQARLDESIGSLIDERLIPQAQEVLAGEAVDAKELRILLLTLMLKSVQGLRQRAMLPMRVQVFSGDQKVDLGRGNYVDNVEVWVRRNPDGSLSSPTDAEVQPPGEGWEALGNNPKIVLDTGQVVYGCQVWWDEVVDVPKSKRRPKPSDN